MTVIIVLAVIIAISFLWTKFGIHTRYCEYIGEHKLTTPVTAGHYSINEYKGSIDFVPGYGGDTYYIKEFSGAGSFKGADERKCNHYKAGDFGKLRYISNGSFSFAKITDKSAITALKRRQAIVDAFTFILMIFVYPSIISGVIAYYMQGIPPITVPVFLIYPIIRFFVVNFVAEKHYDWFDRFPQLKRLILIVSGFLLDVAAIKIGFGFNVTSTPELIESVIAAELVAAIFMFLVWLVFLVIDLGGSLIDYIKDKLF